MKISGITVIALFISLFIFSGFTPSEKKDKTFKGIITYDITYSGDIDAATLAQQPKEMIVKISGNKSRQEVGSTIIINDGDTKTSYVLIDVVGKKYALKTTKEELEKSLAESPVPAVKYIDGETKVIAGYTCKKAEITEPAEDNDAGLSMTLYYTDELGSEELNYGGQFHGLKGWPLEYEMSVEEMTIKYTANSVNKKGKVSATDFMVPEDYEVTTKEKLMEIFGGMEE